VYQEDPEAHLYVFVGGTRWVSGDELREILARAEDADYVNVRW
jgi:hypothetical protein